MRVKIAQPSAKTIVTQLELVGLRGKLVGISSVCIYVYLSHTSSIKTSHFWAIVGYYRTLIRNPVLDVEPTIQCGYRATRNGQNRWGAYRSAAVAIDTLLALPA